MAIMRTFSFTNSGKQITIYLHDSPEDVSDTIQRDEAFLESESLNDLIPKWSKNHKTVLDIGANIGNHAVFFDEFFDCEKILAFEPHPLNYEVLKKNSETRPKVETFCFGLSDYEGTADIHIPNSCIGTTGLNFGGGQFLTEGGISSCFGGVPIRNNGNCIIKTLDSLQLDDVTFIKMDIEGHEIMALNGARETLRRNRPVLFIEDFHDVYDNILLDDFGYRLAKTWPRTISINKIYVPNESF